MAQAEPDPMVAMADRVIELEAEVARLREALRELLVPVAGLLLDAPTRRYIAPDVWTALERGRDAGLAALEPPA